MMRHKTIIQVILLSISMSFLSGCKEKAINPEDDIPLFKDFIEENIDKVADDPYISSTLRPDDEMYEVMLKLQRGIPWSDSREEEFNRLIEKGNTQATILHARMAIINILERSLAISRLAKAMSEGNPYAAYWLSNKSSICLSYIGSKNLGNKVAKDLGLDTSYENKYCTEEIYQKAVEGFKKLAAQGDLRAQYFLLKDQGLDKSVEKREEYIKEVIRFAESHYYQPLMDYTSSLRKQTKEGRVFSTEKLKILSLDLFRVASNNYYIPAMSKLVYYERDNTVLFDRLKKSGGRNYFWAMAFDRSNELTNRDKYCHAVLFEKIYKDMDFYGFDSDWPKKGDYDESICETDKEIAEMKPMIYIDYFTKSDNWGQG
ncbi:tryptophanase [Salinivibrio sp. YCSC6]|uniref:tryptophanase n=1 Tax=Salinivibrio sp. YCSC6 TaxID=2003370 RepID=UPI000BBBD249|nr:tryptophanase [Salinivibrio sp. YCSC6]PCE65236.1 hypothetical protein B6G00_14710 [Salinivibrio sp. YCSC6]QCF37723.1 sel1 repeat family protein [Salinivibrio sp. YCSC6]